MNLLTFRTIVALLLMVTPLVTVGQNKPSKEQKRELNCLEICKEAKAVLSHPYDERTVDQTKKRLNNFNTNQTKTIAVLLTNYKEKNAELKTLLAETLKDMKKLGEEDVRGSYLENAQEICFNKMANHIEKNKDLLDAQSYPYLYDVLREAFNAIWKWSISDMETCIKKLPASGI